MNNPLSETTLRLWMKTSAIALAAAALTSFSAAAESPLRLTLSALTLLTGLAIFALGFLPAIAPTLTTLSDWLSRPAWQLAVAAELTLFCALALTPAEQTGGFYYYFLAAFPFLLWVIFTDFSLLLLFFLAQTPSLQNLWQTRRPALIASAASLFILALLALFTLSAQGAAYEDYWYGAGVPLLAGQIFLAFLLGLAALTLPSRWRSAIIFLLVWLVAAFLWAREPVRASFFVTAPMPPNSEFYPYADPSVFDINSQYALIGQGLNNGVFYDRVLYLAFLAALHTFFGQNYETLMAAQAALFAIFPALIFLIGEKIHSRAAGVTLAALITLRGLNSIIASAWIDTSAPKHMLTDFPTAIGLALFALLVLHWLEKPSARWAFFGWALGALGFTSLLRPHVMLLTAPLLLLALWQSKRRLALAAFGLLALTASIGPWAFFGGDVSLIDLYRARIENVINERYRPAPKNQPLTPEASAPSLPPAEAAPALSPETAPQAELPFPLRHLAHNLLTSAVIFPVSPQFFTLKGIIRGGDPFWDESWRGAMTPAQAGWLTLSLLLVALGSGAAFAKAGWRGWLPWGVFFVYTTANALARTSGGRYLVPMDWIVVVYFALGLAELPQLALGLLQQETTSSGESAPPAPAGQESARWKIRAAGVILSLGLLGGLLPLTNHLFPRRYTKDETALRQAAAQVLGARAVDEFLAQPGALILEGRALYPRFLKHDQYFRSPRRRF